MMKSNPQRPPILPSNFTAPSPLGAKALFVSYALSMTFVPGLISYLLVTRSGLDRNILSLLVMVLSIISGFGFYVVGHIGHEGFHFTLSTNKLRSALIGTMFSASIIGFQVSDSTLCTVATIAIRMLQKIPIFSCFRALATFGGDCSFCELSIIVTI